MNDPGFFKRQQWLKGEPSPLRTGVGGGFYYPIMPSLTAQGGASMTPGTNPIQMLMELLSGGGQSQAAPPTADPRAAAVAQVGGGRPGAGPFPPELMQSRVPPSPPEQYPGGPSNVRVPQRYSEEADMPDPYQGNPTNKPMHPGDYDPGKTTEQELDSVHSQMGRDAVDDPDNWPDTPEEFTKMFGREPATDSEMDFYYGEGGDDYSKGAMLRSGKRRDPEVTDEE